MITIEIKKKIYDTEFSVLTTVENKDKAKTELRGLYDVLKDIDALTSQSSNNKLPQSSEGFSGKKYLGYEKVIIPYPQINLLKPADYSSSVATHLARMGYFRGLDFLWEPQRQSFSNVKKTDISSKSFKKSLKSD